MVLIFRNLTPTQNISASRHKEVYQKWFLRAVAAWNVMLFPEKDRSSRLDELLATLPRNVRKAGKQIIEELMVRKARFFSKYKRMIVDFQVTDSASGWHLSIMSTAATFCLLLW